MIGLSTPTFDPGGSRILFPAPSSVQQNMAATRRLSRAGLLDGGVSITDLGFADGDRTIRIDLENASPEDIAFAFYLLRGYGRVQASLPDGAYLAAPESCGVIDGTLTMVLLVESKISG